MKDNVADSMALVISFVLSLFQPASFYYHSVEGYECATGWPRWHCSGNSGDVDHTD